MRDLTGEVFEKLTVIKYEGRKFLGTQGQYSYLWECKCECGNIVHVTSRDLISKNTKSCGCIRGENYRAKFLNKYDMSGEYGVGYFNSGGEFYFDKDDYDLIKDYTWYKNEYGYAITLYKRQRIRMHRLIMNVDSELHHNASEYIIDHINGVTYDNRKSNLRICTQSENCLNKKMPSTNTSGYVGVGLSKGKYRAYIQINNKYIHLGTFDNIDDAIKARKDAELKYFGKFSRKQEELINV